MKNFDSIGDNVKVACSLVVAPNTPPKSGDPCVVGRLAGVAAFDGVSGDSITLQCKGVFKVSVTATGNGVSVGETLYIDPATAVVSNDLADVPFGTALEALASGTATIKVRLFGATPGATGANS